MQATNEPGSGRLLIFSHGHESSPQAVKIKALRPIAERSGWRTAAPDYRSCPQPADRVKLLCERIEREPAGTVALWGSSLGGAVSVFAAQRLPVAAMFLLAPAVYWPGYEDLDYGCRVPLIEVVHGWRDDIVPSDKVVRWCGEHAASLHLLDDDHALVATLPETEALFVRFLERAAANRSDATRDGRRSAGKDEAR